MNWYGGPKGLKNSSSQKNFHIDEFKVDNEETDDWTKVNNESSGTDPGGLSPEDVATINNPFNYFPPESNNNNQQNFSNVPNPFGNYSIEPRNITGTDGSSQTRIDKDWEVRSLGDFTKQNSKSSGSVKEKEPHTLDRPLVPFPPPRVGSFNVTYGSSEPGRPSTSDLHSKNTQENKTKPASGRSSGNVDLTNRPPPPEIKPTNSSETKVAPPNFINHTLNNHQLRPRSNSVQHEYPKSPREVLQSPLRTPGGLTSFEQKEILTFSEIFFWGGNPNKIKTNTLLPNEGFDDEKGDYKIIFKDHVAYRYEIMSSLGKGAFGHVVKVFDHKTKKYLALKIIKNRSRYFQQAQVELKILHYIKSKSLNCKMIEVVDHFNFRNHFCMTFPLLGINLYDLLKANQFRGFDLQTIRIFAFQLLKALKFLAKNKIMHCDLKPENILLDTEWPDSNITLIDFGSSCFEHERVFNYIQSRFYRSPEVILGGEYTVAIDTWSLGCILAEFYTGYPLFPGENELDQLACMMEILDVPPPHILEASSRKKYFFGAGGRPRILENSYRVKRIPGTKDLRTALNNCPDLLFIDFVAQCLKWSPKERITPSQALAHPWISQAGLSLVPSDSMEESSLSPMGPFTPSPLSMEDNNNPSFDAMEN